MIKKGLAIQAKMRIQKERCMKPNKYFRNRVIVITGAGSGIGKALCEEISQFSPQKIILADINLDFVKFAAAYLLNTGL